ncbi:MAG: hypothetical protein K9M10_03315 [Candidatus Pacebacteria bacterium]|nr:hypothetical protein [Candidatus Paceibacterota bacterium]MCF7857483.1 hypothetical protein [Candidatus Paceibacterota bacterium]
MFDILRRIFDIIFPPDEDNLCVRNMTPKQVRLLYHLQSKKSTHTLSDYKSKEVRALIHEGKFHANARAWLLLNVLFNMYLKQNTCSFDYIIPIPLSNARMRSRGYNQVHKVLLARNLSKKVEIETGILKRTRNTKPQTDLPRDKRLTNLEKAFVVTSPSKVTGAHILLVDDVVTTGATLSAAKASLLPHSPASITCVAFAH